MTQHAVWVVIVLLGAGCLSGPGTDGVEDVPPAPFQAGPDRMVLDGEAREFDIVTDPHDPQRLTMGYVIPKPSPRFYWLGIATSADGGASWQAARFCGDAEGMLVDGPSVPPLQTATCPFAGAAGITDPALSVLHDGTILYLGVMVHGFDVAQFAARFRPGELEPESVTIIARSAFDQAPGSHMVPAPLRVYYNGKANVMQEQDGQRIHAVWAVDFRFEETGLPNTALPVWVFSDDDGRTWSAPRRISGHDFGDLDAPFAVGADIVQSLDGRLHVVWWDGKSNTLQQVTSPDGGNRWYGPRLIADAVGRPPDGPVDFFNVTRPWLEMAYEGPRAGELYVVYDHIEGGDRDVMMVRSDDHGLTWSEPVRISHLEGVDGQDETLPRLLVEPSGALSVLYVTYDGQWRSSGHRMHVARAANAWNFEHAEATSGSSPLVNVGDYNGLAWNGTHVIGVWEDGRGGPTGAHRAWQAAWPGDSA